MGAGKNGVRKYWGKPLIALFFCYPLAFAGPLSYLIVLLLMWALNRSLLQRNWILSAILLLANPLTLFALRAAADYVNGAPSLHFMGLPNTEFWNIDRKTRCFKTTGGCLVDGDEWVVEAPNNLTLYLLCSLFGPPSKSYDGPYPDKVTALRVVSAAPLQKIEDLRQCRFSAGNENFRLSSENANALGSSLGIYMLFDKEADTEFAQVQVVSFDQRCLILRAVELDFEPSKPPTSEILVLLDKKNLRPFCYYQISGDRMPRSPRFRYLPEHSR